MGSAWDLAEPSLPTLLSSSIKLSSEISDKENFIKEMRALASIDIPVSHDKGQHSHLASRKEFPGYLGQCVDPPRKAPMPIFYPATPGAQPSLLIQGSLPWTPRDSSSDCRLLSTARQHTPASVSREIRFGRFLREHSPKFLQ